MIKFDIIIGGEDYAITQHHSIFGLFSVSHRSGVHNLARKPATGEWNFVDHILGTEPIDLDIFKDIIEAKVKESMKTITVPFDPTPAEIPKRISFNYPASELMDYEPVYILPIDTEGQPFADRIERIVVAVRNTDNPKISQFEADVHV